MINFGVLFISVLIASFPNEWALKAFISKSDLDFVRSDVVDPDDMLHSVKQNRFSS